MNTKKLIRILSAITVVAMIFSSFIGCTEKKTSLYLVKDGKSTYEILYTLPDQIYAAYSIREEISDATDVSLSVRMGQVDKKAPAVVLSEGNEQLGDCGFSIKADGDNIVITSNSLAGFDGAIKEILSVSLLEKNIEIPLTYEKQVSVDSGSDYVFNKSHYNSKYLNSVFYNDKNDSVAYVSNAMWHALGAIDDGQDLVYTFGNEPTYFEWVSEKIMWSGEEEYINGLKSRIQSFPQTSTGYLWSWSTYPYWQVSDTYSIHYDGTFRYISAVYDIISWEGNTDFLYAKDTDTAGGQYPELDASNGMTVLEKTESALNYILNYLHGKDGYIQITEESTYINEDGTVRFDYVKGKKENCWNNTGRMNSSSSNYWDNLCFGNYDAYENALFYQALQSMIGIYKALGSDYENKISELTTLLQKVKETYDEFYWSETTGRYIACIDTQGNEIDYGLTFLNLEALKYGLGSAEKARSVFEWIDGERIVEGDSRTGEQIMSYYEIMKNTQKAQDILSFDKDLSLAPTVNTLSIDSDENHRKRQVWWHAPDEINVFRNASYGTHCENGGYIFYPVFYELMARTEYLGAQSTTDRLEEIAKVYEFNALNSDAAAEGSPAWLEGLIGEFPESGLVPTVYTYALVGLKAEHDGLYIEPNFNDTYEYMGIKSTTYGGIEYGIEVNRNGTLTLNCIDGKIDMSLHYFPERFDNYTVDIYSSDGELSSTETVISDKNGYFNFELEKEDTSKVVISPIFVSYTDTE